MSLELAPWSEVSATLPQSGRHLLAAWDESTVTVFVAHHHEIGAHLIEQGRFGGPRWRLDRVTRFRTGLGRVMARSQQGRREGRESVLGLTLAREAFDAILRQAVHWREFPEGVFGDRAQWRLAVRYSQVVMDWAPDCGPDGADLERLCPRFGMRKSCLEQFCDAWILGVHDLSDLCAGWGDADGDPLTPRVRPYPVADAALSARLLWSPEEG